MFHYHAERRWATFSKIRLSTDNLPAYRAGAELLSKTISQPPSLVPGGMYRRKLTFTASSLDLMATPTANMPRYPHFPGLTAVAIGPGLQYLQATV